MTKSELQRLREKQPNKWAATIASQLNVTQDQVRKVLRGDSNNPKIVAAAVRLANKKKAEEEYLSSLVAAL